MKPIKLSHIYIALGLTLTIVGFQNCSKMGVSGIAVEDAGAGANSQMGLDPALSDPQLADPNNNGANANNSSDPSATDSSGMIGDVRLPDMNLPGGAGSTNSSDIAGAPESPIDMPTLTQMFDNLPSGRLEPIDLNSLGKNHDSTVLTPEDYSRPYSGICSLFEGIQLPVPDNGSTKDVVRSHMVGSVQIEMARDIDVSHLVTGGLLIGSARNVKIKHVVGGIVIKSAQSVEIGSEVGRLRITANEIPKVSKLVGAACLNAVTIGVISRAVGGTKIIAKDIEEISNFVGTVHIYGALVKKISHGVGKICLHNGADVLDASHVTGSVVNCD